MVNDLVSGMRTLIASPDQWDTLAAELPETLREQLLVIFPRMMAGVVRPPAKSVRIVEWLVEEVKDYIASLPDGNTCQWLSEMVFEGGNTAQPRTLRPRNELHDILQQEPTWHQVLQRAVMDTRGSPNYSIEDLDSSSRRLQAAFAQEYRGTGAKDLVAAVKTSWEPGYKLEQHYGRAVAIVNSSGLGKSKTIDEISKHELLLSVCFRATDSPNEGWPPRDRPAVQFFTEAAAQPYKAEELAAAFYGALFSTVASNFDMEGTAPSACLNTWTMPETYNQPTTQTTRYALFEQCAEEARRSLAAAHDSLITIRPNVHVGKDTGLTESQLEQAYAPTQAWHGKLFEHFASAPRKRLAEKIILWTSTRSGSAQHKKPQKNKGHKGARGKKDDDTIFFFLAFDECAALNTATMSLIALQRIIKAADYVESKVKFWHFLLDTTSSIFETLHSNVEKAPSSRLGTGYTPLAIWPYVSFDIDGPFKLSSVKTAGDSLSVTHLAKYGRPLWKSIANTYDLPSAPIVKLIGKESIFFEPRNQSQVFAVFSHKVLLELANDSQASSRFALTAVQRHMRILMDIMDRNIVETKCPSEPILSIAATVILTQKLSVYQQAFNTLVDRLIIEGTVRDVGTLGELGNRMLFSLMKDLSCCYEPGLSIDKAMLKKPFISKGKIRYVTLKTYLETMLPPDLGINLEALPDEFNNDYEAFMQWASTVYLNFTHFVAASQDIAEVRMEWLALLWDRTCAVQCTSNQPIMDGFLVGYRGDLNQPFNKSLLLMIPWQTKNRRAASISAKVQSLVSPRIVQDNGKFFKPQHLVLFLDLATSITFQAKGFTNVKLSLERPIPKLNEKGLPIWKGYVQPPEQESLRWVLNIRGSDLSVFPLTTGFSFHSLFTRLGTVVNTPCSYREQWEANTSPTNII